MNVNNWASIRKSVVTEEDVDGLREAHSQDEEKIKAGWRWYHITKSIMELVPCDEEGKPTKEGERKIAEIKSRLRIK